MKVHWNFLGGWGRGRGDAKQKAFCGGSVDIFWNCTLEHYFCLFLQKLFHDKSPYTIMFGPDKCGEDKKVMFMYSLYSVLQELLYQKASLNCEYWGKK